VGVDVTPLKPHRIRQIGRTLSGEDLRLTRMHDFELVMETAGDMFEALKKLGPITGPVTITMHTKDGD